MDGRCKTRRPDNGLLGHRPPSTGATVFSHLLANRWPTVPEGIAREGVTPELPRVWCNPEIEIKIELIRASEVLATASAAATPELREPTFHCGDQKIVVDSPEPPLMSAR